MAHVQHKTVQEVGLEGKPLNIAAVTINFYLTPRSGVLLETLIFAQLVKQTSRSLDAFPNLHLTNESVQVRGHT
jgi:hypothetical protein